MSEDLVKDFLIESYENLDRLDRDLVELEKDPRNADTLASVFRTVHTIKGTCGFLAFGKLESISHVGETLLSKMRDGELLLDAAVTTGLLAMVDAIREILDSIEKTGREGDGDYSAVIAELTRLDGPHEPQAPLTLPSLEAVLPPPSDPGDERVEDRRSGDDRRGGQVSDTALRIDVGLLDKLMNLVGELVLARNQILQFTATETDSAFIGATQRLNLVTSELQEGVMKTRMQPIGNIWSRFPRIVRDLATQLGKQVRIDMEGEETDLDKAIIEAIKDPLTHVVRNSVDHGIELPAVRLERGKPAEGHIRLRAFHEGGRINIEISDDGGGIDPARIRNKAVQRGLVSNEQASRMADHEIVRLVFLPGFSTAETISNISGRGVGMDVVKTNIEKIGGQVDIKSTVGVGTALEIRIPLTLAIIPALMVTGGDGERYAIPQISLLELVRLEGAQARTGIERIKDALFYRLRGNLLPLVYLNRELGLSADTADSDVINIVVLKADERRFGLVVEGISDTEEIVVKPLGQQLKGVSVFAGATIMGDGKVALILDVLGIAQRANVVAQVRDGSLADAEARRDSTSDGGEMQMLLLFRVGESDRMAIPLGLVARLEEFPSAMIERLGDREVVQYRNQILPLVSLAQYFTGTASSSSDARAVIVYSENGRSVGLVVDQIVDVVSEPLIVERRTMRDGIVGSAIVQQRVTDLVDVQAMMRAVDPTFFETGAAA